MECGTKLTLLNDLHHACNLPKCMCSRPGSPLFSICNIIRPCQFVDFETFAPMTAACNASSIMVDIFSRLELVFKANPKGADPYLQLKIRAHFFNRANELLGNARMRECRRTLRTRARAHTHTHTHTHTQTNSNKIDSIYIFIYILIHRSQTT